MHLSYNDMTVLKHLDRHALSKPDAPHLIDRKNGEDIIYSFADVHSQVEAVARSLITLFPGAQRNLSILSGNRAHWTICDLGVLRSGHVLAPVFTSMPATTFEYAMGFADIQLLFVGEANNWERVKKHIPDNVITVSLPGVSFEEVSYSFKEFLAIGSDATLPQQPDPRRPCTIVFTSGTTGLPKGVIHSLQTLNAFVSTVCDFSGPQTRLFSYLPLAHLGDRAAAVFHATHVGGQVTFNGDVETFNADMIAASPTFLLGVPRIWEKLLQAVLARSGVDSDRLTSMLAEPGGEALSREIRAAMGLQNIDFLVTSTAPTSNAIKEWYARLGMPLHDVYGQTELCPATCSPGMPDGRAGVGPACPGTELKIGENDEILGRGPAVALGYYNNPEKTAETFVDGWVHTGDKGCFDEWGNLHITGRVKDTFKTAKGKYVAPVPIENSFSRSTLVEQQCLYGFGLTQPIMLCTLTETAPTDKCTIEKNLVGIVDKINLELEPHERMAGIVICETPWSVESGVLTHTLKVKRESVADKYQGAIAAVAESMEGDKQGLTMLWVE